MAALSFPASRRLGSGHRRPKGPDLEQENGGEGSPCADILRATTLDLESQATPGHAQWSPPGASDHRRRIPAGSETELLNWTRADLSTAGPGPSSAEEDEIKRRSNRKETTKARVPASNLRRAAIDDGPGWMKKP